MTSTLEEIVHPPALKLAMVAPQILDSQLCNLLSLERPSADEVQSHLSLLLLLFPTVLVNIAYMEENDFLDTVNDRDLRQALSSGSIILLTSALDRDAAQSDLTWELLEAATQRRTESASPLLQREAIKRLHRLRDLDAQVRFLDVEIPPLAKAFRERIKRLATSDSFASTPDHLVPGISPLCGTADVEDANAALVDLAGQKQLTRRLAYNIYRFEAAMARKRMPSSHRLVKAAVDVAYTSNAPTSLGLSTCYSKANRPYEVAALRSLVHASKNEASLPMIPPRVSFRFPRTVAEVLSLRAREKGTQYGSPVAIESLKHWWEAFDKRCRDLRLDKDQDANVGMVVTIDQVSISCIRITAESDVTPVEMNIVVPSGLEGECTHRDINELRACTQGDTVLPSQ